MKSIGVTAVLILLTLVAFSFLKQGPQNWHPVYYPNPENLTVYSYGPIVESLEQCRQWIASEARQREQSYGDFDYECGLNCKYDQMLDLEVCEETLQ